MSAITFARQAFNREKPHVCAYTLIFLIPSLILTLAQSSITDWVDILTANHVEEEAYDGFALPHSLTGPGQYLYALGYLN